MSEEQTCNGGVDISMFEQGRVVGMHLSERTAEEIAEALSIDLGTVRSVITSWRKRDEPVFTRRKVSKTVRLKGLLFSGGKNVSTGEMRRELQRLGLKHCVVVIKPLKEGKSQ